MSFDRSESRAHRWWDRAVHRHARRGSKIPEGDRSLGASCSHDLKSRGMLIGVTAAVKPPLHTSELRIVTFGQWKFIASVLFGLVLRRTIGGRGLAAADTH